MRGSARGASGNWRPYRDRSRSTCEAAEQARGAGAEVVEGRGLPEGNTASETRPGRSAGHGVSSDLDRVRQVARKDRDVRFTALLHHVERRSFAGGVLGDQPNAAPGVDGVTWRDYGRDLGGEPSGSARPGPAGRVPGDAVSQGVHTEAGRAAAAARGRRVGGQDPAAGGGRGAERRLRAGLRRFLVRVSARARPA